jgi:hypothetical protein
MRAGSSDGRWVSCTAYVLITRVQNEAIFIEQTIKSVIGQKIRLAKW